MINSVYIATSIDGYIADKNESLEWLDMIPNPDPENNDLGFSDFISDCDAIVMGRRTFEMVCSFGGEWPYPIPVFVLSNTLSEIDKQYRTKVKIMKGDISNIIESLHKRGFYNLYVDGGKTIQGFLNEDLIDQLIITVIPTLLGGGISLFGDLEAPIAFKHHQQKLLLNQLVQNTYLRDPCNV